MMLKIKTLQETDYALLNACAVLSGLCLPSEAWSFQSFCSETAKPNGIVLAAVEHDRLLGFLTGSCVLDSADLTSLAVHPDYRRQKIASCLINHFLNWVNADASVFLEVRESNLPARKFYQTHGFEEIGIRKNFYQKPDENAVLMKLDFNESE